MAFFSYCNKVLTLEKNQLLIQNRENKLKQSNKFISSLVILKLTLKLSMLIKDNELTQQCWPIIAPSLERMIILTLPKCTVYHTQTQFTALRVLTCFRPGLFPPFVYGLLLTH